MKRIRTTGLLSAELDRDLARRKRSLTNLLFAFQNSREHQKEALAFSAICMLYGHWEGFVKHASSCYTNFVDTLGLSMDKLSNALVATSIRSQMKGLRTTNKITLNRDFVELLRDGGSTVRQLPWQAAIETYDNLSSEVLFEVLLIIGCDPKPYRSKKAIIDDKLLHHRNSVAHNGVTFGFDPEDYGELHNDVIWLLSTFRDDVDNAAITESYLR